MEQEDRGMRIEVEAKNYGTVLICAERYAIGRHTYMPSLVADYVRDNLKADPGRSKTAWVMARDIREFREDYERTRETWLGRYGNEPPFGDMDILPFEGLLPMLDQYAKEEG